MLLLIDLDGTIVYTLHPTWKPYKDGQDGYRIDNHLDYLVFFPGSKEFIKIQKDKGNKVLVVSDSHPRYVEPICKFIGCDCVSLADKPNKSKLDSYLVSHPDYKHDVEIGDCVLIGDTALDIELGRRFGIPTIWIRQYPITDEIKNTKDKVGDEMSSLKMGPTYVVQSFVEIQQILDNSINKLYAIESAFAGGTSSRTIKYGYNRFRDGSYAALRCLARQESGICDRYARADKYYLLSNPNRSKELLSIFVKGINAFINQDIVVEQNWNYITYLTDKETTVPRNKMEEIFEMVDTPITKVRLLKWSDKVMDSLRNQNLYAERKAFLKENLYVNPEKIVDSQVHEVNNETRINLRDKNIIVIDDQLTTGATAWYVIHELKDKGAKNILFITLFQMILSVENDVKCPQCGKQMQIKIRRCDGHKFYSCTPPQYRGNGCGYIMDIPD